MHAISGIYIIYIYHFIRNIHYTIYFGFYVAYKLFPEQETSSISDISKTNSENKGNISISAPSAFEIDKNNAI